MTKEVENDSKLDPAGRTILGPGCYIENGQAYREINGVRYRVRTGETFTQEMTMAENDWLGERAPFISSPMPPDAIVPGRKIHTKGTPTRENK